MGRNNQIRTHLEGHQRPLHYYSIIRHLKKGVEHQSQAISSVNQQQDTLKATHTGFVNRSEAIPHRPPFQLNITLSITLNITLSITLNITLSITISRIGLRVHSNTAISQHRYEINLTTFHISHEASS